MEKNLSCIRLVPDTYELNPLLDPGVTAKCGVTAVYEDGSEEEIPAEKVVYTAETLLTTGGNTVAEIGSDGVLKPLVGGYVRVKASCGGFEDHADITVRPFYLEYHKSLTYKLFLAFENYGSLREEPSEERDKSVEMTFAEAADLMKRIDNLTLGLPKIVYLVGWQRGGHDHLYPAFSEVNPRLKRPCDKDALTSLRWLIREGRKYNTTVSLHINLVDAYNDSPLWDEYLENHVFEENADGSLKCAGGGFEAIQEKYNIRVTNVVNKRLWETGFFEKRMNELFAMIPELCETHTLHIDNWRAIGCEAYGISREEDELYIRKMYEWYRAHGFDITSEGSFHGRREAMVGLQPMTWFDTPYHPAQIPPSLYCGGRACRVDFDPRFGDTIQIENAVRENRRRGFDLCDGLQSEFCLFTLPWRFLNEYRLLSFDGTTAEYTGGVKASLENGLPTIYQNGTRIRYGTTVFVPLVWKKQRQIVTFSFRDTYLCIRMPENWQDVSKVDVYYLDRFGRNEPSLEYSGLELENGDFRFPLDTRCALLIVPHGETLSAN